MSDELDNGGSNRKGRYSPVEEFVLFMLIFGVWGPLYIVYGIVHDSDIVGGIIITVFMYWIGPGGQIVRDFLHHITK